MKKIAIIGGGAAGCAAAWALKKTHDITLYEAEAYLGGHAYSHDIEIDGKPISVDMGVEYFHERISPNFLMLLQHFNIDTYIAPLSFKVFNPNESHKAYWSNSQIDGEIKHRLFKEMNQFHLDMNNLINENTVLKGLSMQSYLDSKEYSTEFKHHVLLPLMTTFSGCKAPSLEYTLTYIALSFNMNLLSFYTPCHWRKIKGGVQSYYRKMKDELGHRVHFKSKITSVEKQKSTICVTTSDNVQHHYDEVIFACQAEVANAFIKNIRAKQREVLSAFEYVEVQSILHSDTSIIDTRYPSKEYCQFKLSPECNDSYSGTLTRINNNLYPYQDLQQPLLVSFDNDHEIDPNKIICTKNWKLPKLRPIDFVKKRKVAAIQGKDHFWYCGTDYSITGHEGAIASGLVIAERLGAAYPFKDNYMAQAQFDMVKGLMGIYSKREKIINFLMKIILNTGRKLNLHKRFAGQLLNQILF